MNVGLDVRPAVREANEVFRRFPVRISFLPVLLGLLTSTTTMWTQPDLQYREDKHIFFYFLCFVFGGFVLFWINCFTEVVVSTMYLRAREGEEPGTKQLGEALHYRGFASLAWGLLLRCLGWWLLLGLAFGVVLLFAGIFTEAANTGPTNSIGATAGGIGHGIAIVIGAIVVVPFVIVATLIFCRYMFLFPMLSIERASRRGFLDECVRRTKQIWKTAAVVMLAGGIPALLISGMQSLAWKHMTPPHGVRIAVEVAGAILTGCFTAWFILVKTGLAMQLMPAPIRALESTGERSCEI
jgi:hypothetical protein